MANRRRVSFVAIKKEMKAARNQASMALRRRDVKPAARVKLKLAVAALEKLGRMRPWGCGQPMFLDF